MVQQRERGIGEGVPDCVALLAATTQRLRLKKLWLLLLAVKTQREPLNFVPVSSAHEPRAAAGLQAHPSPLAPRTLPPTTLGGLLPPPAQGQMAAAEPNPSLPHAHEDHPTSAPLPLSEWAIHHHGEGPQLPLPPQLQQQPPEDPSQQPIYPTASVLPSAPPAQPAGEQPYPAGGAAPPDAQAYPAGGALPPQPYPDAAQPYPYPAAGEAMAQPYPYPAAGGAMAQPYPAAQPYYPAGQPAPFPQLTAPPMPYPPYPPPPADPVAVQQSSGPRLEAHKMDHHTSLAAILNVSSVAMLVCCILNVYGFRTIYAVAFALLYFLYVCVSLSSPSAVALRNHMGTLEVLAHTHEVRMQRPEVWCNIVCFHMEQRTRHVVRTVNGKARMHTEHYQEKVVTHTARAAWGYRWFRDISGPPVYHPELPTLEIHFKPVQDFADPASAAAFHDWRAEFLRANTRDSRQDVTDGMDIAGLRPFVMVQQGTSCLVRPLVHALAVVLGLGTVYDCLIFQRIPQTKYCALGAPPRPRGSAPPRPCARPFRSLFHAPTTLPLCPDWLQSL
jgi:hypothetical protein